MGGGDREGEIGRGGIGGWVGRNRKYRISRYRLLLLDLALMNGTMDLCQQLILHERADILRISRYACGLKQWMHCNFIHISNLSLYL